jgi:hypothetical protein
MESSAHLKGRKRTERNNHQVCATFQPLVRGNISCPMPSVRTGTTSSAACAAEPLKADQARSAANTGRTARFLRIAGLMFGPLAFIIVYCAWSWCLILCWFICAFESSQKPRRRCI